MLKSNIALLGLGTK